MPIPVIFNRREVPLYYPATCIMYSIQINDNYDYCF